MTVLVNFFSLDQLGTSTSDPLHRSSSSLIVSKPSSSLCLQMLIHHLEKIHVRFKQSNVVRYDTQKYNKTHCC